MMNEPGHSRIEIAVGAFVALGLGAIVYLATALGGLEVWSDERITLSADFATVAGLRDDAAVDLAGVTVGRVASIELADYHARVTLEVRADLRLPRDTMASIETRGLLGDVYVALSPGGAAENLTEGERIARTEPPLDLRDLVSKVAFGDPTAEGGAKGRAEEDDSPFEDPLE